MTATEDMSAALLELVDAGARPPCGDGSGRWVSEDHTERAQAVQACQPCPLLGPCAAAADEARASFGVFGGRDRSPRPQKARTR